MENTLAIVNRRYEAAKAARRAVDREIKLNIAFYNNRQWVVYDPHLNKVVDWNPPNNKPRLIANIIVPVVRIEFAKITKNAPEFRVVTTTPSPDDVAKAKLCHRFLEYKWSSDKYDEVFKQALLWALVTGTGFVKVYYDPDAGPVMNGSPLGDVVIDYCSPLELYIDPLARSLNEASWVIHARVRTTEYVEMKYGVKVSGEEVETTYLLGEPTPGLRTEGLFPVAVVKEYWERPNAKNPRGKYVVFTANKILYEGDNPYADICPIPFAMMKHIPVPGRLYGNSVVTYLRHINVLYNKIRSDIAENTTKLSNPPLIAPINSLLNTPTMEPGEIIYYNPLSLQGGQIRQLEFEPYPTQVMNTLIRLLQERDDISGINDVSRGIVPRGVRSGQALAYLLEQDETRLAVTAAQYEQMIEDTLRMVLHLARNYYDVARLIRLMGDENVTLFKGNDIPADADVRVEAGSTLPKSSAVLQDYLMQLWDRGIITDPRLLLRLTHYGSTEEIISDLELDSSQAQRENNRMAAGETVEVYDYQNHVVHIAEHNRFRKTAEYEKLSEERREQFAQHVEKHKQFLAQLQGGGLSGEAGLQGQQAAFGRLLNQLAGGVW